MSFFFTYNDKFYPEATGVITPDNRSFRYGDGLFETVKVVNGVMQLRDYHFQRLFDGIKLLQFEIPPHFNPTYLETKIAALCKKNQHDTTARVRLTVFRGNGGQFDPSNLQPNYVIQSWPLDPVNELNSNGLVIDVYPDVEKPCDVFSNVKSNSFLPYTMAALHAKKIKVNDCVLLNTYKRICDTSIANIFIIKDGLVTTPPLSEGCIAGVTRRFLVDRMPHWGFNVAEQPLNISDLENADGVFLSNAIKGIRWVKEFGNKTYTNVFVKNIHEHFVKTIH